MKKLTALFLAALILITVYAVPALATDEDEVDASIFAEGEVPVTAAAIEIAAPSAILIEKTTGTVLYEKNADTRYEPASVTKIMTVLLIAEHIDSGSISMDDTVTVSARASSMGGSQVFLAEGETMDVKTLLKCVVVSSANDAAVALAEHIAGTEQGFVSMMNARAAELGMENTTFYNCTGLDGTPDHKTTARDIALMSRELLCNHAWIKEYTTIWTDTIRGGEFGLSNTNKLVRFYPGATGLKTGFTSAAGHCLSASAERDGVEFIAVVLNCDSSSNRFESAKTLLSFGFANYTLISPAPDTPLSPVAVSLGVEDWVSVRLESTSPLLIEKNAAQGIERKVDIATYVEAPVKSGDKLGTLTVSNSAGNTMAQIDIVAETDVNRLTVLQIYTALLKNIFAGCDFSH